jgi:putative Holliday junction resolvase
MTAQNPSSIRTENDADAITRILKTAKENSVSKIVVGFPRNMDGTLGPQARKVQKFASELSAQFEGEVVLWDERFSTKAATRALIEGRVRRKKRRELSDGVSALILLQNYLDSLKGEQG